MRLDELFRKLPLIENIEGSYPDIIEGSKEVIIRGAKQDLIAFDVEVTMNHIIIHAKE